MSFRQRVNQVIGVAVVFALCVTSSGTAIADEAVPEGDSVAGVSLGQLSKNEGMILISEEESEQFADEIATSYVEVEVTADVPVNELDGEAEVTIFENGAIEIEATAFVDGVEQEDRFEIIELTLLDTEGESFTATLRSNGTGELVYVNTEMAEAQAWPVLAILAVVARSGIKYALKWYGKSQVKKAAKSFMLNSLDKNKWNHIMASKHKWSSVGAKSREQVAEISSKAMSEGTHVKVPNRPNEMRARYKYKGRTVVVQYNKATGQIGDAWVE